jgi:hypothetical protein
MTNESTVRSGAGLKRVLGWLMVAGLLLLALGAPSSAAAAPPGNNGTLKIHDTYEPDPVIKNEPHVDCPFHAHFFFADPGQTGSWWIQEWSPGDKGDVVWGPTTYGPTNSCGEWVTGPITLDAGHYKIFWEGRNGNNIKHKAFWVDNDCEPVLAPAPTPTPTPTPAGGIASANPTPTPVALQLPNTATVDTSTSRSDGYLWQIAFAAFAGLLAAALVLSPVFPLLVKRIRR